MSPKIPWVHASNGFFCLSMLKIHGFTSTFVAICSDTSYPFGIKFRRKRPPLDILKFRVTTLINQDNKFAFIQVDKNRALARSYEFMRTCHNINIIVQNKG